MFLPVFTVVTTCHVVLNFFAFPAMTPLTGEIAKHAYEGVALGLYSAISYFISYFTERHEGGAAARPEAQDATGGNKIVQGGILALVLYIGLRITDAISQITSGMIRQLSAEGEIKGITPYGMSVIDNTLVGNLFFFSFAPLCVYMTLRVRRKLGRNPGYWFFMAVSFVVFFSSIITNHQSIEEWNHALATTLEPIIAADVSPKRPRDVLLFVAIQASGAVVLSAALALFMWSVAALRGWIAGKDASAAANAAP